MLFYFHMPDDRDRAGHKKWFALSPGRLEDPVAFSKCLEVASFGPVAPFSGMASSCPVPDLFEHLRIDPFEDLLGDNMAVKHCPPANDRIEFSNQLFLGCRLARSDNVSDLGQKGLHVLLRRGYQNLLPTSVLSDVLAQKIEPFRDVRDGGLLFREFETPFFEKGFHHRLDLVFQELFRVSRNHESGSRKPLPAPRPLRTGRASFPATRSNLS